MSITADEVNFLIRRYLQESGFQHTAFMFSSESMVDDSTFDVVLPPQAMITILKKGMLYMQIEKGINEHAKTDNSPEHIILAIMESIKQKDPIQAPRQQPRPKSVPTPPRPSSASIPINIPKNSAMTLRGHYSDVFCGCWSPDGRLLATGSADAQAIIWEIQDNQYSSHLTLDHAVKNERMGKDIATLAWNYDGSLLATGCYDGSAKIWTSNGELLFSLNKHREPIFALQFSPDGQYLLTGSSDFRVIMWNTKTGEHVNTFSHHEQRVLDIDWYDNRIFATCSGDSKVCICVIDQPKPIFTLTGHTGEVNKICWDTSRKMLASCSDDTTVRVFRPFDRAAPIVLQGHTQYVYAIKWAPNNSKILVSGSFDFTVRVWDVQNHQCLHVISQHQKAVYSLSFSPRGNFFVSGGAEPTLYVWRTSDAALVASYQTNGGIFEAIWNPTGESIALCLSDATVALLPTNTIPAYSE
ncbi:transducin [Tritrichomonas foetus]|uniref:Transducin n=1 Tax=Tritrichomonas foetus TaxID=1144522 RepID=A0A1J4KCT5_9EUKA|nr:transducin [Tritrichomonas foetus]|eukprot:OHT09239.1 transducin [Tritrichomonas foetus]